MGTPINAYHLDCPHCGGEIDLIPESGTEVADSKEKPLYTLSGPVQATQGTGQCPGCKQPAPIRIEHLDKGFNITFDCQVCG